MLNTTPKGSKTASSSASLLRWAGASRQKLALIVCGVLFAIGIAAGCWVWRGWGHLVLQDASYVVTPDDIHITPQPDWIHADVKAEVIRDGSLHQLSLLDAQATVTVARAFKLHPWVAQVHRVKKQYGPKIEVQLTYRRPVAMVEVAVPGGKGLLPIDAEGVLLPPDNFPVDEHGNLIQPEEVRQYPRIVAEQTVAPGMLGSLWGERRITEAAKVAEAFGQSWNELQLQSIVAPPAADRPSAAHLTYELTTRGGTRILWGHAPGQEMAEEPSALEKISRLAQLAAEHGSLDNLSAQPIDLRDKQGLRMTARPPRAIY